MIKRINPFVIVGVVFVIFIFVFISTQNKKTSIQEGQNTLAKYETKAKNFKELKNNWKPNKSLSKLNFIVSNLNLSSKVTIKDKGNLLHVSTESLDKSQTDLIVKKVLNEMFEIKNMSIKRIDDKSLKLDLEVSK